MLFRQALGARIVDGSITMTFRAWSRPQARAGNRHRFGLYDGSHDAAGFLEIDAVDLVPIASITNAQAHRAGFVSIDSLVEELRRSSRTDRASKVYRVSFRFVRAPDERAALAANAKLTCDEVEVLYARLERMDARAESPWTGRVQRAIAEQPGVSASVLARQLGFERDLFKANVRKLKALGLTISLETGYRVSPRGEALMRSKRT